MDKNSLLLLMAGSFLPNNMAVWALRWITAKLKREQKKMKLVSPHKYYVEFQSNPKVQYKYHRRMSLFWLNNFIPMNVIVGVDIWATLSGHNKLSLLTTAILLAINTNYSLYANFDTEIGDAHGAYAGMKADELSQRTVPTTQVTVEPPRPLHVYPELANEIA